MSLFFFAKISNFLAEICKICSREDAFLVDFEKCCKMRICLHRSAPIQPKTSDILPKICQKVATTLLPYYAPSRVASADRAVWKSGCVCSVRARSRSKIPERSLFSGLVDPCGDRGSEHTCLLFSDKFDK